MHVDMNVVSGSHREHTASRDLSEAQRFGLRSQTSFTKCEA